MPQMTEFFNLKGAQTIYKKTLINLDAGVKYVIEAMGEVELKDEELEKTLRIAGGVLKTNISLSKSQIIETKRAIALFKRA